MKIFFTRLYKVVRVMLFLLFAAFVIHFVLCNVSKHPQSQALQKSEDAEIPVAEFTIYSDAPTPSDIELVQTAPIGISISTDTEEQSRLEPVDAEAPPVDPEDAGSIDEYRPVESKKSLFIGDSRTVGLANYASIEDADYFAAVGMTVYNAWENRVSIPQIGKVTLDELLNYKQYDIIYIMLGVNELGYAFDKTVTCYETLLDSVRSYQSQAIVILMANIHVTLQRSESDKYINNPAIDRFNEATSRLSDNKRVFYLNANSLFDDAEGNLAAEKSADSAHLKAKYCAEWGEWLIRETASILLQAEGEKSD